MTEATMDAPPAAEEGTDLFPLPDSALGKAAKKFVDIRIKMQALKLDAAEQKDVVLAEMKKEGRETLTISAGAENWFFEIVHGTDDLRCTKQTRQPIPKTELTEE
jgi:hypothetical protein